MAAVKSLCTRGIVLENGTSVFEGSAEESVDFYLAQNNDLGNNKSWTLEEAPGNDEVKLLDVMVTNGKGQEHIFIDDDILIHYKFKLNVTNSTVGTTIIVSNQEEQIIFSDGTLIFDNQDSNIGIYNVSAKVSMKLLNAGSYSISILFGENKRYLIKKFENIVSFNVELGKDIKHNKRLPGSIYQELDWDFGQ
jgi:lipopolysaccharide transport system ATP-binding protein